MKLLTHSFSRMTFLLALILLLAAFASIAPAQAQSTPAANTAAWDGHSRFTILLMGMDRRPSEQNSLLVRTDAIFLVSLKPGETPQDSRIGILHIPRDLHFTPPNSSEFIRVNTLMELGEQVQAGYGATYAMEVLQYNLGIYIDRYVLFDFQAFTTLVDAMGGVEITTDYPINDPTYPDMNYGYDPFYLPRGTHVLDGHRALQFARTRHSDNDFLRGARQLQLISAIQSQIAQNGLMDDLIRQAPDLYAQLDGQFYTDLTLNDLIQLALYAHDLPPESLLTDSLDTDYNISYGLPNGSVVYIPDRARLIELLTGVFGTDYTQP